MSLAHNEDPGACLNLHRRKLIGILIASGAFGVLPGPAAFAADDPSKIPIEWKVPADRLSQARSGVGFSSDQVAADPSSVQPERGLPLLYILIGAASLIELAKGLVAVYKDLKTANTGTTIVDGTGKTLKITHDPAGRADLIIVRSGDGKVEIHDGRKDYDATKWLELLAAAKGGGAAK